MARDLVAQNLPEVGNHSIGRLNQDYPDVTSVAPIATRWGLPLGPFLQFRGRQPCATHGTLTPGTAFYIATCAQFPGRIRRVPVVAPRRFRLAGSLFHPPRGRPHRLEPHVVNTLRALRGPGEKLQ
jgi:hypothetical protein